MQQSSRSHEENVPFSAESESELGKTSSGIVAEKQTSFGNYKE